MKSLKLCLFISFAVRILLIYVSTLVDSYYHFQYTDIDYVVITDGSKFYNPYNRKTFRYPPIIAWLVIPNHYISQEYGKILFSCIDTICSYIIHLIIIELQLKGNPSDIEVKGQFTNNKYKLCLTSTTIVWLWALNPLSICMSTRGSFDCLSSLMLLMTMLHVIKKHFVLAGLWYGLFIHVRIYPIIYVLVYLIYIFKSQTSTAADNVDVTNVICWIRHHKQAVVKSLYFLTGAFSTAFLFSFISYCLYGNDYIDNAILYHAQRVDFKHNFSFHFYYNYLFYDEISSKTAAVHALQANSFAELSTMLMNAFTQGWASILLITFVSFKYAHHNFILALFLVTLIFVAFNRVITAQVGGKLARY